MSKEINFEHITDELMKTAKKDGEITKEEEDFISSLQDKVVKFQVSLSDATSDDFITEDEWHDLIILRDGILADALDFQSDSEDINRLLQKLWDEVNKHTIPGMEDDEMIKDE